MKALPKYQFQFEITNVVNGNEIKLTAFGNDLEEAIDKLNDCGVNVPNDLHNYLIDVFECYEQIAINEQR